jgi:hypothetical protein
MPFTATHGLTKSAEYGIWSAMKRRCYNTHCQDYPSYGGRGIKVCEAWLKFENFYADMGPRPSSAHSIDRLDNNGDYEPGNCRWSTPIAQARNTRRNVRLTFNGKTQTISEWAYELGFSQRTLQTRLKRGWPIEAALTTPLDKLSARRKTAELRAKGFMK